MTVQDMLILQTNPKLRTKLELFLWFTKKSEPEESIGKREPNLRLFIAQICNKDKN